MSPQLHDSFSTPQSFMYFAEGLRAYHNYQVSGCPLDLKESARAFSQGGADQPGDAILRFYSALIRLEQVSAAKDGEVVAVGGDTVVDASESPRNDGYATASAVTSREGAIMDALLQFEQYQRERLQTRSPNRTFLLLWSQYNRGAAQVHRLNPQGYLRARGILGRYMSTTYYKDIKSLPAEPDVARWVSLEKEDGGFDLSPELFLPETLRLRLRNWWPHKGQRNSSAVRWFSGPDRQESRALLAQMESLFNLTRSRPLREPEALRRVGSDKWDVRPEQVERVEQALSAFEAEIETLSKENEISVEATRDLTSDMWSQRGHLHCARALGEAGCSPTEILEKWRDLTTPIDNRRAFEILVQRSPKVCRPHLERAAVCFRTALVHQPRWRPAVKNLGDIVSILTQLS